MDQCRICLEEDNIENMISPCLCRGHMKYIHRDCLNQWRALSLQQNNRNICPTCKFKYQLSNQVENCSFIQKKIDNILSFIIGNFYIFILFNQIITFLLYSLIIKIRGSDKIIIEKNIGLSIENYSISSFILIGLYIITILLHFSLQKNKILFCKNFKKSYNGILYILFGIVLFIISFDIFAVFLTTVGLQVFIQNYLNANKLIQDMTVVDILSLDDEQISLLTDPSYRNVNLPLELELSNIEEGNQE